MKYLDEFREKEPVEILAARIRDLKLKKMNIMEVCGSQTHTIMKYGLEELLPDEITLIHGPGCPVCVTPAELIDQAIILAGKDDIILASYGDMLRVPGSGKSLLSLKAEGADIRIIYSPLDAVEFAVREPGKNVVLFAIGFETTAPANASALTYAKELKLNNFFLLPAQVLIPPPVDLIFSSAMVNIDGLLAPGHVCTVTGYRWCEEISSKYNVPIAVTGFEPVDILEGILAAAEMITEGNPDVYNQYRRLVRRDGNPEAQKKINQVFRITDRNWRGLGLIPMSGYELKDEYLEYDARRVFDIEPVPAPENAGCIAGEILQGRKKPEHCLLFGNLCTPENPVGAPMVSSEGVCAAYFRYRRISV